MKKSTKNQTNSIIDITSLAQKDDFWAECRTMSRREQLNTLLYAADNLDQLKAERCIDMDMLDRNTSPEASAIRNLLIPQEGEHMLSAEAYRQIDADERELNFMLRLQAATDVSWERFSASLLRSKEDGDIDRLVELYQTMQVYAIPDAVRRRILRICFDNDNISIDEAEALRDHANQSGRPKEGSDQ